MKIKNYITNIAEIKKAYALADKDKKLIIEDQNKILVIIELSKEQAKKIVNKSTNSIRKNQQNL